MTHVGWYGRVNRSVRASLLLCILLLATAPACSSTPSTPLPQPGVQPKTIPLVTTTADVALQESTLETQMPASQPLAAFVALRHPDTTGQQEPYPVSVRRLAGPEISGGQVAYSVLDVAGKAIVEDQVKLRPAADGSGWESEIPGQPVGSTIAYHFLLDTRTGRSLRHPARAPARYQFRVVGLQVLSVTLPNPASSATDEQSVTLRVQSASPPSGELVVRVLSLSSDAQEYRIALSTRTQIGGPNAIASYVLEANVPDLQPGELADFYFQVHTDEGEALRVPAGAPNQVYTIKRSARSVQPIPDDGAFVLDVGVQGRQRWIGLKGGGAWEGEAEGDAEHWGLLHGLPSGIARFVLPDPVSGHVYLGTDRGVVAIEPGRESWVALTPPYPSPEEAKVDVLDRLGLARRAGPGALSTLDGTLLFQLQGEEALEAVYPETVLLQFQNGRLGEWTPHLDQPLIGLSTATFDAVDGCWLLGGFVPRGNQELQPAVVRQCDATAELIPLEDVLLDGTQAIPERIVALAREPTTGGVVLGLEFLVTQASQRRSDFGVYQLNETTGALSPLVPGLAAIGTEVTSLATDWRGGQVLVGTFGQGLILVGNGEVRRLDLNEEMPSEITAIEVDEESGTILVGTARGAVEISDNQTQVVQFGPRGEGAILTNAHPTDANMETGRVLLSSYDQGLIELSLDPAGEWRPVRLLRPGRELPDGFFGKAQYAAPGSMYGIVHSQGLLQINDGETTLLDPDGGLHSPHLLNILTLRGGDVWLAFTPMPFGAFGGPALQVVRDGRIVQTLELADSGLATIGDWVEVAERDSIFAATRAGVVEIRADGDMTKLSKNAASSIARNPDTGVIGVAGTTIERWEGERFIPVLFRVDHPRWPKGQFPAGSIVDLAIDRTGAWYLLYSGGIVAVLDSEGRFLDLLDPEDGIPPTARQLLAHPTTGDVFVGSNGEGLVIVSPDR